KTVTTSTPSTEAPAVIIEEVDFEPDSATLRTIYGQARTGIVYYRISAHGKGLRASSSTLQSILATRYN
ncbi:MAG: hypothetical protein P8077_09340, partial [Gammaproteobacteria bacterium]